jgi:hypothetical protein
VSTPDACFTRLWNLERIFNEGNLLDMVPWSPHIIPSRRREQIVADTESTNPKKKCGLTDKFYWFDLVADKHSMARAL